MSKTKNRTLNTEKKPKLTITFTFAPTILPIFILLSLIKHPNLKQKQPHHKE